MTIRYVKSEFLTETKSSRLLRTSWSKIGNFKDEIFPVLILSNLVQLQLHVRRVVLHVNDEKGIVTAYAIKRGAGEDLHR